MILSILALLTACITNANASAYRTPGFTPVRTIDSDLAPPRAALTESIPQELQPDSIQVLSNTGPLVLQVMRQDHGVETPVTELEFSRTCAESNPTGKVVAALTNPNFEITHSQSSRVFQIAATVPCKGAVKLFFKQDSNGGQALGIWQIASRARAKLKDAIGLSFWRSKIKFVWPDTADYYAGGAVHITRGDQWDVVGHEMGHGIYDLGDLGVFGGGQHKIDECYSKALALSEGWASFFSAWVSVGLADPDAKFEYMVPRRAPIRFENIPEDVCKGDSNEWRVTGFFWDLIDQHDDHETSQESFARTWNALAGSQVGSASAALPLLQKAGIDPKTLQGVWDLNFRSSVGR